MESLPLYISVVFILTTMATLLFFLRAARFSIVTILLVIAWLVLQAFISKSGFYTNTAAVPPRFVLAMFPPLILIAAIFALPAGRRFIDALNIKTLTLLHVVRIPVELTLLWLFMQKTIPAVMTFEGHNFDIVSGLTAPVLYYFVFVKKWAGYKWLLLWNLVCLLLVFNIAVIAVLSAPFRFQQLAFEQPNIAIMYFPFIWLPSCIVPIVIFAHLASIRQLVLKNKPVTNMSTAIADK